MPLQSDSQGFLIGDVVTDIRRATDHLLAIRADIRAIKNAVSGVSPGSRESGNARGSDSGGSIRANSLRSSTATPTGSVGGNPSPAIRDLSLINSNEVATPGGRTRDASGRFIANRNAGADSSGAPGDDPEDKNKNKEKEQGRLLNGFANRIATAITATTAGAEEADPTIKAFKEVAEPLARGYEIFAGGDKKERWYRKIFGVLNKIRGEESIFNRIARSLHNIENNPGGSGGAGGSGGSGGVGGGLIGMLAGLMGGRGLLGAGRGLLGAGAGLLGGAGRGLLGAGKGLFKRIPILGALLGGMTAASDVYGAENDNTLARGEKDRRDGKAAGGLAGSFAGMAAGAKLGAMAGAFGGPIGAAIGGVVGGAAGMFFGDQAGQIIGEKMGEWTTQLREADIPGKIVGAWETTTSAIKSGWDGALKLMSDTWGKAKDLGNAANDFVKDKTGIDVKAEVKNAYDDVVKYTTDTVIPSLVDLKNKGVDAAGKGAQWVGENTTVGKGAKAAWNGMKSIGDILRGGESGKEGYNAYNRGTGLGSNGHRDLTNMTIADIQSAQELPKSDKGRLMAVGKYQMMPSTLKEGAEALKLGSDAKFDEATQEKLFSQYLLGKKRPQIQDYITGKSDDAQAAQIAGAKEWRSIADPRTGKTYADKGASGNKASISSDDWLSSMDAAKKQYQENLKLGLNETEAYSKAVSGLQAVTAINEAGTPTAMPSLADDPTQSGRFKYETLEGGTVQVTDSQDGTISLASDEQANAYRKQQGKPYLDAFAKANNPDSYRSLNSFVSGPGNAAQVQVASAPPIKPPVFAPPPPIPEAPPIIEPLASNSNRSMTVSMPAQDVGQDVKDRGIAHIVTGGYSSRG